MGKTFRRGAGPRQAALRGPRLRGKMRRSNTILLLASLLAFPDLLWVRASAQVSGGAISGAVTNASQAAVPNARVTLKDVATGVTRAVTTDAAGFYTSPDLAPGTYEMTVEASGFTTQMRTNVAVTVGAKLVVNVGMQ